MAPQRYQRVSAQEDAPDHQQDDTSPASLSASASRQTGQTQQHPVPSSPPPSFRSRASSITHRHSAENEHDPLFADADRTLADTFDAPSDSDSDDEDRHAMDDRQRVMSGRPSAGHNADESTLQGQDGSPPVERRVTQLPAFPPSTSTRTIGGGNAQDGVFANLSAKVAPGEEGEEKPPSYEQAAADATPPYWENTILAPGGSGSDEVYIDGLPVGSLFSFVWNGMISMSFQLVGFLLTYLLHTTHAAKNGSKAGLGITLVQYGFSMKGASSSGSSHQGEHRHGGGRGSGVNGAGAVIPPDPNAHAFDPNSPMTGGAHIPQATGTADAARGSAHTGGLGSIHASDWFAYALMIVGWFVLIRAISEYLKARRHETLVLQSPSRGLNVAVVAEGEETERSV